MFEFYMDEIYEITEEQRAEIEEHYRQLKDFWKLEDFKSTKYIMILFHIVMTLIGYLYYQIYKEMEEGTEYRGKSSPVILKNYKQKSKIYYIYRYIFIKNINVYIFIKIKF